MMSINRWIAVSLMTAATVGILESAAGAEGSNRVPLPRGIHQKANGRYVQEACDDAGTPLRCRTMRLLPERWQPGDPILTADPPQPAALSLADVEAAYSLPSTAQANGKIVAIISAPDNHALADLSMYRSMRGLPAMERCNGLPTGTGTACFAQVVQDGGPSTNIDPSPGADAETSLDVDMISYPPLYGMGKNGGRNELKTRSRETSPRKRSRCLDRRCNCLRGRPGRGRDTAGRPGGGQRLQALTARWSFFFIVLERQAD